jgi:hypothetical protein
VSTFEEQIQDAVREAHRVADDRAHQAPHAAALVAYQLSTAAQSADGELWLSPGPEGPPIWSWTLLWEGLEPRRSLAVRVDVVSGRVSWSYSGPAAAEADASGSIPFESFEEDSLLEPILSLIDQRRWTR